jgi:hypothetical protein
MSVVLLALHLVVFALGGALAGQTSAHAASRRAIVTASSGAGDGAVVVSASASRLELGTRPRGDRGDRGAGTPSLDVVLPRSLPSIAPAGLSGTLDGDSAEREMRPPPSVVNGARGPPTAR